MRSQPISAVFKPGDRVHLKHHARTRATIGTVTRRAPDGRVFVQWDDNGSITPQETDYLEPAGEPMSTKQHFGNAYGTLKVRENGESGSIYITIDSQGSLAGVGIEDAPALALAVLEAAGVEPLSEHYGDDTRPATSLSRAAHYLSVYANQVNAAAKEAADREALEGEAWQLYVNACEPGTLARGFEDVPALAKDLWLRIARAARELHNR